jgi:hypothetical protein
MPHNFASYKPGSFSIDVSNLAIDPATEFFEQRDIPALVHEYCHYIQDITTISSIFGFSLWMRDVVALTGVFAAERDTTIKVPLKRDIYGESINKYRKLYNLYCGDANEVYELNYDTLALKGVHNETKEISIDGRTVLNAINHIEVDNPSKRIHFGLIALQEIQAYYAQLLAEDRYRGIKFSVEADSLPAFPYKFGDFLFREFRISIDLPTKFVLIDLCLDTIQAPTVFIEVLKRLKGETVTFFGDMRRDLVSIVDEVNKMLSHDNSAAFDQIIPDLKSWAKDTNRKFFSDALNWYVDKIEMVRYFKNNVSKTFFSLPFCMSHSDFASFYTIFPPPVYFNNGVFFRNMSMSKEEDHAFNKEFEAATTIWSHRIVYDLLCAETFEDFQDHSICPLYEKCETRIEIGDDYTCKTAPWEIVKNEKKIFCQYGMATHSFGLWQNTLDIDF